MHHACQYIQPYPLSELVGNTTGKIKDRRVELATDRYSEADVDRAIRYFEKDGMHHACQYIQPYPLSEV